jgi:hypothetical protein
VKQPHAAIIESRFAAYFANWNLRLPRNAAALEEPGTVADDGWVVRYVFGSHSGEPYLEFCATHRMTDDRRVRIWGPGRRGHWVGERPRMMRGPSYVRSGARYEGVGTLQSPRPWVPARIDPPPG